MTPQSQSDSNVFETALSEEARQAVEDFCRKVKDLTDKYEIVEVKEVAKVEDQAAQAAKQAHFRAERELLFEHAYLREYIDRHISEAKLRAEKLGISDLYKQQMPTFKEISKENFEAIKAATEKEAEDDYSEEFSAMLSELSRNIMEMRSDIKATRAYLANKRD